MNGMGVLLKGMGIDVEDLLTQAHGIGQAFADIRASQARQESLLLMICDRLEIARPLSQAELDFAASQSRVLIEAQESSSGSGPLSFVRSNGVGGGIS